MIDEMHIRDVASIHEATMLPAKGLTVVTGETGAGKTALLSGIKLLVGERGGSDMIRDGAESLEVEGRFFVKADSGEEGTIAKRSISLDGRSRVHIDSAMATVGDLASGLGAHVDLCGQHEHQQLLKTSNQVLLLDAWAGERVSEAKKAYVCALDAARAAQSRVDAVDEAGRLDASRVEEARFVLRQIDAVNPEPGEYEQLLADVARIEHAEDLRIAVDTVRNALAAENAALDELGVSVKALESIAEADAKLSSQADSLKEATFLIEDVVRAVGERDDDELGDDAVRLEQMQERLASFQGLMRSYGPTMVEVAERRAQAAGIIAAVDDHDEHMAAARKELAIAEEQLGRAGEALDGARREAAPVFAKKVCSQMDGLEMGGATLVCSFEPRKRQAWTEMGPSKVEFLFCPGPGMGTRPLNRITSGGEVSRVMLSIKVVLGEADGVDTLVFDEVDAGVGGKTARSVAEVLVNLAKTHQVIVVTHLPQIAVEGDVHYLVEKTTGKRPETILARLEGSARIDEVARMLSGEVTPTSRGHAAELLKEAHA